MDEQRSGLIRVSHEMVTLLGNAPADGADLPAQSAALRVDLARPASVTVMTDANTAEYAGDAGERTVTLIVTRDALARLFDWSPAASEGQEYFLDAGLVGIADQMLAARQSEAQATYRLGKSIELLCDLVARLKDETLQRAHRDRSLSQIDSQRVSAAFDMIDAQWSEKLTLGVIANRCGLNRTKLSRGFRELYRCSVSEALASRRLAEARRQLLATDLPVSLIGYRSGYTNNASFSRAFGRHFGQSPSELRSSGASQ
jgi:AraC family transcriptional activator of pyochelin receptor